MSRFDTRKVESVRAKELVEELVIDGVPQLYKFEKSLEGTTYKTELISLLSFVEHFANGGNPGKKVKYLRANKGSTEFEFISKHLRIYAVQHPEKKIIIFCGKKMKADSSDNIKAFRNLKAEYEASLKDTL